MSHSADLTELLEQNVASRLLDGDASVFIDPTGRPYPEAAKRLGWVRAPVEMAGKVESLEAFAASTLAEGLTEIYLLGMGGSSLCAEVLRDVPGLRRHPVRLVVLDTTDERTIRRVTAGLSPSHALFIVASKSGRTIEVTALEHHFWSVMTDALQSAACRHFVAITDPATPLKALADARQYRATFLNPEDIGGRFSALSLFGLVPAALLGMDLRQLLSSCARMIDRCRENSTSNPGLALGAFIGGNARADCDKLTLLLPPSLAPLGPWIEQLVAESTGKLGKGALPVVGEPVGAPSEYGADRAFVAVVTSHDADVTGVAEGLGAAGHEVFRIETSPADLGAEFLRWEMATAVAGRLLGIDPFDQPDVELAKTKTAEQLAEPSTGGPLEDARLAGYVRRTRPAGAPGDQRPGRYFAILDYLPPDARRAAVVEALRARWRRETGVAVTYGIGPRYLHSTGQYHKGGRNTGLFLLLTAAEASPDQVPGKNYSFASLKRAQALGDFLALDAKGREVMHYHVADPSADFSAELEKAVLGLR
jgi:glucose-6-phosphate isomerase